MSNANSNRFQIFKDFPNAIHFSFPEMTTYVNAKGEIKKSLDHPTKTYVKDGKTYPVSILPKHKEITKSYKMKGHTSYAFRTGEISGITVLDIDSVSVYETIIKRFPFLKEYYTVRTHKGYHIYFNYDSRLNGGTNVMDEFSPLVDIRNNGNLIYCPPTQYNLPDGTRTGYTLIGGTLNDFPDELFVLLNSNGIVGQPKEKKPKTIKKTIVKEGKEVEVEIELEQQQVEHKLYTKEQLMLLVDLLNVKRADEFSQWVKIGIVIHQCNNTKDGFDVFNHFSKKSTKYTTENDCKGVWNTFNKSYDRVTIGSLIYWARMDNKKGFEEIADQFEEPDYFQSVDINTRYILDEDSNFVNNMLDNWMMDDNNKIFSVKSPYGTGKTQTIHYILDKFKSMKKILFITYRQTLTHNLYGNFKIYNFRSYLDNDFESPRLICQLESLHKLMKCNMFTGQYYVPEYDLVVFDECESTLAQLESSTVKHKLCTFNVMDAIMKKSKKILALDGDFSNKTYGYLKSVNKEIDFKILKNTFVPSVKHWMFTNNKKEFDEEIIEDLQRGRKLYICTMSAEMGKKYEELIMNDGFKVCFHYGSGDDSLKQELQDVNSWWIQFDAVIVTPTVESGVDFNVKNYFYKQYVVLSSGSTHPRGLNQMTNRVRKYVSNKVKCFLNGLPFKVHAGLYRKDEVDCMFDNHLSDLNIIVDENGNITNTNKAFTEIHKYNYLETLNKNKLYFVPSLIKMLHQKGQMFSFDGSKKGKNENDENDENEFEEKELEEKVNKIISLEDLVHAPIIDNKEYLALLKLQKQNLASREDKLKIEKYMYKVNWQLDDQFFDEATMRGIYRKTHIMFNQKEILGEQTRAYVSCDPNYQDIDLKIKIQKLKIVNELLQMLGFKFTGKENPKEDWMIENDITGVRIHKDDWFKRTELAKKKSKLFNDKTVLALFGRKKTAITSNKSLLGFVNTILKNYGMKIASIKVGQDKVLHYELNIQNLMESKFEHDNEDDEKDDEY